MLPIDPINVETCLPHYGRPVGVILNDGTRHIGILSRVTDKQLILNEFEPEPAAETKEKKQKKRGAAKSALHAVTAPDPFREFGIPPAPYSPWGGRQAFNIADVSLLFLALL